MKRPNSPTKSLSPKCVTGQCGLFYFLLMFTVNVGKMALHDCPITGTKEEDEKEAVVMQCTIITSYHYNMKRSEKNHQYIDWLQKAPTMC